MPSAPPPFAEARRHGTLSPPWATAARRLGALLALAWGLLLAAWLVLHWGILPHIDQWREPIEQRASQALGLPLKIGQIRVRSTGWVPAFDLQDVRVFDRQGREALRLARVSAALAPRSLLVLEPRLAQLLVDDVELDVRRDADGRLRVAGLDLGGGGADDNRAADWLFAQHEIVIRGARVRWTDERRGTPPLELTDVQFVLRNGLRRHALRLDATPPAGWGKRFTLRGQFSQPLLSRAGEWRRWHGSVYAELPHVDVAGLGTAVTLPFELHAGRGAVRAWVDIDRGRAQGATVDLALDEASLRLQRDLPTLALQRVQGRLSAQRNERGVSLAAEGFGFATAGGLVWPAGALALSWQQALAPGAPAGPVTGGEFSADRLDLGVMAMLADRLPLGQAVHHGLQALAPQGVLQQLSGRWEGPLDAPVRYSARGRAAGLHLAAGAADGGGAGRPGVHGADIEFSASEAGGDARLSMTDGALEFPGVFEAPRLPLQTLSAQVRWTLAARAGASPAITLTVSGARFANADAAGRLDGSWTSGAAPGRHAPGVLDLRGKLEGARAAAVARYLPLALPEPVRRYVADSVQGGTVSQASFRVQGDLREFPFIGSTRGDFQVRAQLRDVQLAYVPAESPDTAPAWPVFTQVQGELHFERGQMQLRRVQARQGDLLLRDVHGGITDLRHGVLQLEGAGRGPLGGWLRYIEQSPLGDWLGGGLRSASGSGDADLTLALRVPLSAPQYTSARGSLQLAGNRLQLRPDVPALTDTRARIDFTEGSVNVAGATARLLGGQTAVEGGSAPNGGLRFSVRGTVTAEGLQQAPEAAMLAPLAARLRGQAGSTLQLGFVHGHPEVLLTSPLTGLAIELPAPLDKPAGVAWPLRLQTTRLSDHFLGPMASRPHDSVRLDLGRVLQARFVRDLSGAEPVIERGGIAVLDDLPNPDSGVAATLRLGALDLDEWRRIADGVLPALAGPARPGWWPLRVKLRAERLGLAGRRLTGALLELDRVDDAGGATTWRSRIQADQAEGRIDLRWPAGNAPLEVSARLSRWAALADDAGANLRSVLQAAPASVPALDLVVDDLEWDGVKLGRVEVLAVNQPSRARPAALEWRLARLNVDNADGSVRASGVWAPGSSGPGVAARRMLLDFRVAVADAGALAERLGAGRAMRGGRGELQGRLSWPGSPLVPQTQNLDGEFSLALADGRLLQVEPGAARLLGVLSLQMLPRRLLLDFSDITGEGFGFDKVAGGFQVARGIVSTNSLQVSGPQATVQVQGRVDTLHETQDLDVQVVPVIGSAGAALAVATVNPVAGLGTLLAGALLREPLTAAATREYRVSGAWRQPKIERFGASAARGQPDAALRSGLDAAVDGE
jgi:uncharacterized protein (TIGR02099 family)